MEDEEPKVEVTAFVCVMNTCEHDWSGPAVPYGDCGETVTCSKCGMYAITWSIMFLP